MKKADILIDKLIEKLGGNYHFRPLFNFDNLSRHYRLIVLIFVSFIIALLLTPQITINHPTYQVGMIAKRNIRADHDFSVIDRNALELKKTEAAENVKTIYDYDPNVLLKVQAKINKALPVFERLNQRLQNIKQASDDVFFVTARKEVEETLEMPLSDNKFETLIAAKFSNKISEKIKSVVNKAYRLTFISDTKLLSGDVERGIVVRDIKTQQDSEKVVLSDVRDIETVRKTVARDINNTLAGEKVEVRKLVYDLSAKMVHPNLSFNKVASEKAKQDFVEQVPAVYSTILKNEIVVREGERISEANIDKIEALLNNSRQGILSRISVFGGTFIIVLIFAFVAYIIVRETLKEKAETNKTISFLALCLLLQIFIVRVGIFVVGAVNRAFPLLPIDSGSFAISFALSAMLIALFLNRYTAVCFAIIASLLTALLFENKLAIISVSFFGSVVASYHIFQCRRRSSFFRSGFILGVTNVTIILAFAMIGNDIFSVDTLIRASMGFIGGFIASFIVCGFIPIFETAFGYTTNIRLLEIGNLNQPIFQQMIIEAPGTYHHSIITASLVEAAAEATGADPLLAKTAAFYHDIGKIKKSCYFIENQTSGENKHDKLTPKMSGAVIISHIKDGCDLAKEIGLPKIIVDIIKQHHGTSIVSYFYNKAKNDQDESTRTLTEENFRYPGPKPQTKEAGLVMLADIVEASSRSLSNPTPARIKSMVRERIERVFLDGQLDECPLTLSDLYKISSTFTRLITGIFHQRVDYLVSCIENGKKPITA